MQVKIHPSWQNLLQSEFDQSYFEALVSKVKQEYSQGPVFPQANNIFRAFDLVTVEQVKVVILGQDPYHTSGVADGLAFSSIKGNRVPPSLKNIYKEIKSEFDLDQYLYEYNPDLTRWAEQGVLLLNNTLTVRSGEANSHAKFGWDMFTDAVIKKLSNQKSNLVFILWGGFARNKKTLIDRNRNHLILESAHPSPLSAHNGFFGNNHFIQVNQYLTDNDLTPINW
jgi:uracil-DNA glycosylase